MGWNIIGIGEGKNVPIMGWHILKKSLKDRYWISGNGAPGRDKENDDDAACERILRSGHMDFDLCRL
jgi:hypothetical protein